MLTIVVGLILAVGVGAQKVEAEGGTVGPEGGASKAEVITEAGHSGTGYVSLKEGSITIAVTVATAGFYNLKAKYRVNDPNGKIQNLVVNGVSAGQMSFPNTGTVFTEIVAAKKLSLQAGTNNIQITKSWGWVDIDYIEIVQWVDTPFNINPNLVSPNPIAPAVELYNFLKAKFAEKKVISGVMTLQGSEEDSMREPNWLFEKTGEYPALLGLDFMHQTGKNSAWYVGDATLAKQVVRDAQDYYSRGGIVHLLWHWRDPSKETDEFYSPSSGNTPTTFSAANATDNSTTEYQNIITDLDVVAAELLDLQNKGVAVLWRPFHEAAGKWFWWGYEGPAAVKELWKIMFERFTVHHGLKNLIWVWTSNTAGDALDWYPGDNYVDIVGADIYPSAGDHNSQVGTFEQLKEIFQQKKIIALTECGSIPDPEKIVADGAHWSFFMPWYRGYTIPEEDTTPHNDIPFWKKVLSNGIVLNLDDLPRYVPPQKDTDSSSLLKQLNFLYLFLCLSLLVFFI